MNNDMLMDLNQLLIFAKVAENQSFTKAAQELGMEKSTVSTKVSQLEQRLGARLLNRTTRQVTLTEVGESYYQYCRQIVESAREADHFAETFNSEPRGVLRISTPVDFGQLLVRQIIRPFLQANPKLKIDLSIADREVDLIAERFDLALRVGPGELKDSNLVARKLFDIPFGLFATAEFLAEYGTPRNETELSVLPFIIFNKLENSGFELPAFLRSTALQQVQGRMKINDLLTCKEAACQGLGIGILPVATARYEVASGLLQRILPEMELSVMALFAVYPSRQWMPSKLKAFLQHIQHWQ